MSEHFDCPTCSIPMLSEHDYECATCGVMASEHIGVTSMCKVLRAVSSRESSLLVERDKLKRELAAVTEQRDRYKLACDKYSEDESLCKLHEVTEQRDRLAEAGKILAEEYEDRRSQWGGEYLWQKYEDAQRVDAAIAVFTAAVEGGPQ